MKESLIDTIKRINKLIDVKSIVTIMLTVVFCILAITAVITAQEFLNVFTTIVAFYFCTQANKTNIQK